VANIRGLPQEERSLEWLNKRDPTRLSVASEALVWVPRGVETEIAVPPPVELPVVTIDATIPVAYFEGPIPGEFTITRVAADISGPLTVVYGVSGTAIPSTHYIPLTGTVVIPAGQASATIPVTPIPQ